MKKIISLIGYLGSAWLTLATQPLYENNSQLYACCLCSNVPPTIDAAIFVNRSDFTIDLVGCQYVMAPFETQNTLYFTNTGSGHMYSDPGFRFDYFHGNTRERMNAWINQGSVTGSTWVAVSSDIITSSGPLVTGAGGLIRLDGSSVTLKRDGLRVGDAPGILYYGGYTYQIGSNRFEYINPVGISDIYWGLGTNNNDQGPPMYINTSWALNYGLYGCFESPGHYVIDTRYGYRTNFVYVPPLTIFNYTNCTPYAAYMYSNYVAGVGATIQIVYVPQSVNNLTTVVKFYPYYYYGAAEVVVGFKTYDFDIVSTSWITNSIYLVDTLAVNSNVNLAVPMAGAVNNRTRRPSNYELFRYEAFGGGLDGTNILNPEAIIYDPRFTTNRVNMYYTAWGAHLDPATSETGGGGYSGEPTNYPGRIEITGDVVDLDQSRVRAENTVVVRAHNNLVNNKLAKVDAPFVSYDIRSTQSPLFITNMAPVSVHRFAGGIYCWSGLWNSYELIPSPTGTNYTTNVTRFHVMVVDRDIQPYTPVSVYEFTTHATNMVISDPLNISKSVLLDVCDLHVRNTLNLPAGFSWGASNVPTVVNFTNDGNINIPQAGNYGADRPNKIYRNIVNRGTNTASSQFFWATNCEVYGSGALIAKAGLLSLNTKSLSMAGNPTVIYTNEIVYSNIVGYVYDPTNMVYNYIYEYFTNIYAFTNLIGSKLLASGDVQIWARDVCLSNAILHAQGGALIMTVTNSLFSVGPDLTEWWANAGFQMLRRPTNSDLLSTHITSKAGQFQEVYNIWCANDLGVADSMNNPIGFSNNLAVGKLTLNGETNCLFVFSAPDQNPKAMYIDYLELLNNATNHRTALVINSNLTLYIANANISPRKLEETHFGRIRWVPYFAGPFSSTNIVYPSGNTYTFNIALVTDRSLDSDYDGMPNAFDPTPMPEPILNMTLLPGSPRRAIFTWNSPPMAVNWLEQKNAVTGTWSSVAKVVGGLTFGPVSATNTITTDQIKFYRVRTQPPQF